MSKLTLLHNPRCTTSRHAKTTVEEAGIDVEIVEYLKTPLDAAALRELLDKLEDPAGDLVRRDVHFRELGLTPEDVATPEQVVTVLADHPRLMQRPVLVRDERAIIGRPRERVPDFLG